MDKEKFSAYGAEPTSSIIAEMASKVEESQDIDIKVDASKLAGLVELDKDPMFVTMPVACEGTSENGRKYTQANVKSIVDQINASQPDGYSGHLTKEERATKAPDAQTIWLGATTKEVDGKLVAYAKGYVMPDATKKRQYLKTAKALGRKVSVSIYGKFDGWYNKAQKTYDIAKINLESIDWSRPGAEGLPVAAVPMIASEMSDSKRKDKNMDKEEALKGATLSEMKEHNPKLVEEIEQASGIVSEMKDVREQLGIDEKVKVTDTIAEMQQTIRTHQVEDELRSRVKARQARPVIKQMVMQEMKDGEKVSDAFERVLKTDDAKAIISSKVGAPDVSATNGSKSSPTTKRRFTNA